MLPQVLPDPLDPLVPYSEPVTELLVFLAVAIGGYALFRLLAFPTVIRVVRRRNRNNPTVVTAVETYLRMAVLALTTLLGLVAAGQGGVLLSTDSAIVVAALTFAFGVAGQEVFGSLIGGVFLVADPDFNVGDWVVWPGGEGTIEAVDFRVTRIRTPDNETVTVPNTELTTNALTRPFGRDRYRVTERVFVPYDEDTERALMELRAVAADHEAVVDDPEPTARVVDLGPDSVEICAELWIADPADTDVPAVESSFRRAVKLRFDEADLTLAPPAGRELSGAVAVAGEADAGGD